MTSSIYRQYFEAIEGVTDKLKCTVDVGGKKCGQSIASKKSSTLQQHLQVSHKDFYATIQASPKPIRQSNQPTLEGFAVATPGKNSGPMRDLLMIFATSTVPTSLLANSSSKVSD
jgi:hypothetical protein